MIESKTSKYNKKSNMQKKFICFFTYKNSICKSKNLRTHITKQINNHHVKKWNNNNK